MILYLAGVEFSIIVMSRTRHSLTAEVDDLSRGPQKSVCLNSVDDRKIAKIKFSKDL